MGLITIFLVNFEEQKIYKQEFITRVTNIPRCSLGTLYMKHTLLFQRKILIKDRSAHAAIRHLKKYNGIYPKKEYVSTEIQIQYTLHPLENIDL